MDTPPSPLRNGRLLPANAENYSPRQSTQDASPPIICFSHLRWNFVWQRPQHLMVRFAKSTPVFFFEEPVWDAADEPHLEIVAALDRVTVVIPHLPRGLDENAATEVQRLLVDKLCREHRIKSPTLWYYTPMAGPFSEHLQAGAIIYDCMDELSAFKGASPLLRDHERALFRRADLVFTGGHSLYESKRLQHRSVYAFPSSVDLNHFGKARKSLPDPEDQAALARPRMGFCGVIDERLDLPLLEAVAAARPEWQFVMIGPVVKIDVSDLPRSPNIHWLGGKQYKDLPRYIAGWDVALMPFACNEATRFISPTKTPEYLAAGRPVVSAPIADVVRTYGDCGAVRIADSPDAFVAAIEACLSSEFSSTSKTVDALLATMSWDGTAERMQDLISEVRARRLSRVMSRGFGQARPSERRLGAVRQGFDWLIVGAGFAGSVLAERLARGAGQRVLLVDRRPHIGGNAYDHYNDAGILVHRYGPHIFHTNSTQVADYLSRFTRWRHYEHRVRASVDGHLVPIPINLTTINTLYGLSLDADGMARFLAERAERIATIRTSEDVVVGTVGRELYEKFFQGYTRKQWGIDPSELDKAVTARIPTRMNTDGRYFTDSFQMMPLHGFTRMFENMLDHPNIKILLNTDFREIAEEVEHSRLIYTGPIDEYFDFRFGKLPYRSLSFRHETLHQQWFQTAPVVNYPSESIGFTRITEYKYLTGQQHPNTSISYEFPCDDGDPYYPVPRPENAALYKKYQALADRTRGVEFVGRLATYKYYNMDQVVAQALSTYARLAGAREPKSVRASEQASVAAT